MGSGGRIDPGTGRKARERGKLDRYLEEGTQGGAIRRRDGQPVERRIEQKRRQKTGRG